MNIVKKTTFILMLLMLLSIYVSAAGKCKNCIIGKVRDQKGKALAGVKVTVRKDGKNIKSAQTNNKGKFELTNLRVGFYNLVFDKSGYGSGILKNVEVRKNKRINLQDRLIMRADRGNLVIVEASIYNQRGFSLYGAKVVIEEVLSDGTTKKVGSGYSSQRGFIIFRFPEKTTTYRVTASVKELSATKDVKVNEAAVYRTSITLDLSTKRK